VFRLEIMLKELNANMNIRMFIRKKIFRCLLFISCCIAQLLTGNIQCVSQSVQGFDSVSAPASLKYKHPGILIRIANGKNYRNEWGQPVKMPLFDITKEQGGLTITKSGGGHQTKSLRMVSADSTEWALRSVDKSVSKLIPKLLKHTFIERCAQDMISASYPYACLSIAELARASGIITPEPKLVYLPNDTSLGQYRNDFANELYFFEQRHPLLPNTKSEDMKEVLENIQKDNRKIVLQRAMLKARLLDMITGDWDRHQGQWHWCKYDSSGITWYYPVPGDRDQAFFRARGILIKMISLAAFPFLKGFKPDMSGLYQLNKTARNVDRTFLNELSAAEWDQAIEEINRQLTDSIIAVAGNRMPAEISQNSKESIASTLRKRRDGLPAAGMKYFKQLAKRAYVFGSEKAECFEIKNVANGLQVTVYAITPGQDSSKIYQRVFTRRQTRRIYLVSVRGDDKLILPSQKTNISVRKILPANDHKYNLRRKMLERLKAKGQA
jgi:hypothetical protein